MSAPERPLEGRRVVLGVSGSIAAYKALSLASALVQAGARVDVILTRAAAELVRPLAFQALTHRPVVTDLWDPAGPIAMDHIALAQSAEALVLAPATADLMARLALGLADDALTTTALACRAPLLLAPAMEPDMWDHPATQGHAATLLARGAELAGPALGRLASGKEGVGRLAAPEAILDHLRCLLGRGGPLAGRKILVSAGPTREPLDPVRFLSNHSSGKMGYALARAARDRGAAVRLISGPVALEPPAGVALDRVETALEMRELLLERGPGCDAVIMAAAVADHRPASPSARKLKKAPPTAGDGGAGAPEAASLALLRNPDLLRDLDAALADRPAAERPIRVGFAAETEDLVANARAKLGPKGLDLIVANPVPAAFGGADSAATFVTAEGAWELGQRPKTDLAAAILDWVQARLGGGSA